MNKKVVIAIIVVILLLVGGYFVFANKAKAPTASLTTPPAQATSQSSLRDLIAKGISQSCTYSTDNSQGTIYLSSGKIRGDFNVTIVGANNQPETSTSHMIIMDNTNYLWSDGTNTGIKMAFDQNATPVPVTSNTPTNSFDANALNNYKCSSWSADPSLFTLPADVKFTAFSLPAADGSSAPTTGSNSSSCSYCDSLSGDSKTQCLSALNCK